MSDSSGKYGIIPASVRHSKELEPNAKLLYCEITALSNNHGYCFASNQYLAEIFDTHPMTVSRWISSLQKAGFVTVEVSKEAGNKRQIYPLMDVRTSKEGGGYKQKCL